MDATSLTLPRNAAPLPDLAALKTRQRVAWASGDYAVIGTTLQLVGESLCESLDLRAGSDVLDVAAGNGNASLAAARRGCCVTSTDYVGALLDRGRERARAEGLDIQFQEADAEALPFETDRFDAVVSTFGVMFTANQELAAAELVRVCRPGGKIGLANWTPDGFIGQLFKVIGKYVPPPVGAKSPALWGTRERISQMFEADAASIAFTSRRFTFRYRTIASWLDVFRTCYGPVHKAFDALDASARAPLAAELADLAARFNRSGDDTMAAPGEYLEIVISCR